MSKSYTNLLDLSGESAMLSNPFARRSTMPRSATALSLYSESREEENTNSVMSDPPSSVTQDRIILVANMLPLHAERNAEKTVSVHHDDSHALGNGKRFARAN